MQAAVPRPSSGGTRGACTRPGTRAFPRSSAPTLEQLLHVHVVAFDVQHRAPHVRRRRRTTQNGVVAAGIDDGLDAELLEDAARPRGEVGCRRWYGARPAKQSRPGARPGRTCPPRFQAAAKAAVPSFSRAVCMADSRLARLAGWRRRAGAQLAAAATQQTACSGRLRGRQRREPSRPRAHQAIARSLGLHHALSIQAPVRAWCRRRARRRQPAPASSGRCRVRRGARGPMPGCSNAAPAPWRLPASGGHQTEHA